MRKLISVGVGVAMIVALMLPMAVAGDWPDDPGAYSKTPFGIMGSVYYLAGDIVIDLSHVLEGVVGDRIPPEDIAATLHTIGDWHAVNLAWSTDMTGWSMVVVGDVLTVLTPLADNFGRGHYVKPVADVYYVVAGRIFDPWNVLAVEAPTQDLPGAGIGLPVG